MIEVSTSVLDLSEKDFSRSVYNLETAKTDYFHIDVMDGKFVQNDTANRMFDYAMTISHISQQGLDVHLMVNNPKSFINEYIALKPRILSFQFEPVKENKDEILNMINDLKENGIRARNCYKSWNKYRRYKRIFTLYSYGSHYDCLGWSRWTKTYT